MSALLILSMLIRMPLSCNYIFACCNIVFICHCGEVSMAEPARPFAGLESVQVFKTTKIPHRKTLNLTSLLKKNNEFLVDGNRVEMRWKY